MATLPAPHPNIQPSSFAGHPPAHPSHSATSLASLIKITLVCCNPSCSVCHQRKHAETIHHITVHQQLLEWRCTHCHSTPTLAPSVPTRGTQPVHARRTTHPPSRPPTHLPSHPPTRHLPSLAHWPARPIGPSLTPHPDTQPSSYAGRTPILHTTPRRLAVLVCRPPAQPSLTPRHPAFFVCRPCTRPSLAPVQAWRGSSKPAGNTRFA